METLETLENKGKTIHMLVRRCMCLHIIFVAILLGGTLVVQKFFHFNLEPLVVGSLLSIFNLQLLLLIGKKILLKEIDGLLLLGVGKIAVFFLSVVLLARLSQPIIGVIGYLTFIFPLAVTGRWVARMRDALPGKEGAST